MHIIVCVDDRGGMAFNRRRVSRDRLLCEDVVRTVGGGTLHLSTYSAMLFSSCPGLRLSVSEQPTAQAGQGEYCFLELEAPGACVERAESLTVYRWNRRYPFDLALDVDLHAPPWRLLSSEEFAGNSHEKITKEIYVK